ncbi:MAG: tRNA dihydrouridine synthase DusB [Spirochaetes bacterium]|nr:tRNA dihydrouridine synthase DusB [Spirochaetota bacterium]
MPAGFSDSSPDKAGTGPVLAGLRLPNPFFLAPIAGYSDAAFRSVCYESGAALCYTEMVSSEALVRNHPKTNLLLVRSESERNYAVQLFGSRPEVLAGAVEIVSGYHPLVIDLNCGCPVPKIVRTGAGSSLLKDPAKLAAIVEAMKGATDIPITVKIRTGWDEGSINFIATARAAVEAGAAAVTLHGRTRAQGYGGKADWSSIAVLVKEFTPLGIQVFGSGDVFGAAAALRMLEETGCAGVMIARGALGNPFVFAEAAALYLGEPVPGYCDSEVAEIARRHLELSIAFLGEKSACVEFRKHFCSYSKGRPRGAALRDRAVHCSTRNEFLEVLAEFEGGR